MMKTKIPHQQAVGDFSSINFFLDLCEEMYRFCYNLPFIIFSLMSCQLDYHIVEPPPFSKLSLTTLNCFLWILLLPFAAIDLLAEAVVDTVEVAYSTTVYHAVYTGAAIGCLVIGDYDKLGEIREWMNSYYISELEGHEIVSELMDELIGKVVETSDSDETPALLLNEFVDELPSSKLNKSITQRENESGYLTEADVEE